MGFSSIWHWVIVLVIVLLLFGAGKLPKVMGDLAKGVKNFKAGLKDEEEDSAVVAKPQAVSSQPVPPAPGPSAGSAASGPTAGPAVVTPAPDQGAKKDETART